MSISPASVGFAAISERLSEVERWDVEQRGVERAYPSRVPQDPDAAVAPPGWRVERVAETGSTNADLAAAAAAGGGEGLVLVADRQTAGRGRQGRSWDAPPGSGLTASVLLRPRAPLARLGWLPLLTGLAVAEAVEEVAGVPARLKWPNDVLVGDRKLAGVLVELHTGPPSVPHDGPAAVVGLGLNVGLGEHELPVPTATSLAIEGARTVDRGAVLGAVLAVLEARYRAWSDADGDPDASGVRQAYLVRCATVGRRVRVALAAGDRLEGEAVGVDPAGRLRVADDGGRLHEVAAGDVEHVR